MPAAMPPSRPHCMMLQKVSQRRPYSTRVSLKKDRNSQSLEISTLQKTMDRTQMRYEASELIIMRKWTNLKKNNWGALGNN